MASNNLSLTLSTEEQQAIFAQLDAFTAMIGWAQSLSPKERRRRLKAGDASEAFITNALQLGQKYPSIIPPNLDIKEMEKDVQLRPFLKDLRNRLQALVVKLDDTQLVCGGEAYEAGLLIYTSAKHFGKGMGIDDQIEELARRFKQSKSAAPTSPTTETPTAASPS